MQTQYFSKSLAMIAGLAMVAPFTPGVLAEDVVTPPASATSASTAPAVRVSYGAGEVLKLVQAKMGVDTIAAFIERSTTTYNLSAEEIVYLRGQGVSDRLITAMLSHAAAPVAQPAVTSAAPAGPTQGPVIVQPSTSYVQTVPAQTVYVEQPYYGYYGGYYPYYYGYPGVALSFGFGGYYRGGYYHGGGFRGGGVHGGFHGGHR